MPRHPKYVVLVLAVMLLGGLSGCVSDEGDICSSTTACGHTIDVCCPVDGDCYYDYGGYHYDCGVAIRPTRRAASPKIPPLPSPWSRRRTSSAPRTPAPTVRSSVSSDIGRSPPLTPAVSVLARADCLAIHSKQT